MQHPKCSLNYMHWELRRGAGRMASGLKDPYWCLCPINSQLASNVTRHANFEIGKMWMSPFWGGDLAKGTGLLRFPVRNHVNLSLKTPFWRVFYWSHHDRANHERKRRGLLGTKIGRFCKLVNNANKTTDDRWQYSTQYWKNTTTPQTGQKINKTVTCFWCLWQTCCAITDFFVSMLQIY